MAQESTAPNDRKPSKSDARADRILEAAGKLVMRFGFDKTTVDDIAREAGVSKGAIYLHWPGKDDLFEALIWRETWAYVRAMLAAIDADPEGGTLPGMFKHTLTCLAQRPLMRALYNRDLHTLGDYMGRRDPSIFARRDLLNKEFVRAMQANGLIRADLDSQHVGYIFSSLGQGMMMMEKIVAPEEIPPFEGTMQTLTEMLTRALLPENGLSTLEQSAAGKRLLADMVERLRQASPGIDV